jgi:hypothetical protein
MTRDEVIKAMSQVLAGLQVPMSINSSAMATVTEPWRELHRGLLPSGWHKPADYERALREVLDDEPPELGECPSHPGKFGDH